MWAEACEFLDRAERIHRQFFRLAGSEQSRPSWEPPVDVLETEDEVAVVIALPGVPADQVQTAIEGGALVVAGQRRLPIRSNRAAIHRMEIPHGRFERRVELPAGRFQLDRQEMVDGCLVLRLRRV